MPVSTAEYLTIAEVADELRVSPLTVRRRIRDGELPAIQLGGQGSPVRIPRAASGSTSTA
jgi:excisionase family DNA binding protein